MSQCLPPVEINIQKTQWKPSHISEKQCLFIWSLYLVIIQTLLLSNIDSSSPVVSLNNNTINNTLDIYLFDNNVDIYLRL